jgi:hypothetical protein
VDGINRWFGETPKETAGGGQVAVIEESDEEPRIVKSGHTSALEAVLGL